VSEEAKTLVSTKAIEPGQATEVVMAASSVGVGAAVGDAAVQRALFHATLGFASSLVKAVVRQFESESAARAGQSQQLLASGTLRPSYAESLERFGGLRVLVPRAVHTTVSNSAEFEWLSNQGLDITTLPSRSDSKVAK
jgi:hypothetical protein